MLAIIIPLSIVETKIFGRYLVIRISLTISVAGGRALAMRPYIESYFDIFAI